MGVVGVTLVMCLALNVANGGKTSSYVRKEGKAIEMPPDADVFRVPPGYNAPQQYTRKYHYEVAIGHTIRQFWFMTPPEVGPDVPYTFGLIGDLDQSFDLNNTLTHYENNPQKGQTVLCVRDLSYADNYTNHDNNRWDTWGRFVERSAAYQPWIWTTGSHEIDFASDIVKCYQIVKFNKTRKHTHQMKHHSPYLAQRLCNYDFLVGETKPFKPYTKRYPTPFKASNSSAPYWYSIKRGPIVLASYSAYGKYTPQYKWLEEELPKVNRTETPWLIVMTHCPWYNSYNYHYMEGETMRVIYERWFVRHNVDVVFGGHVHAYERFECVPNIAYNIVNGRSTPVEDLSASIYITTGDGGNLEGLATKAATSKFGLWGSKFRSAILAIKNRTHSYYSWYRNHDGYAVEADKMWFFNRVWHPIDDSCT